MYTYYKIQAFHNTPIPHQEPSQTFSNEGFHTISDFLLKMLPSHNKAV